MRAFILRALVLSIAGIGVGCSGEISNFPTTPDPVVVTETFSGTININGAATHAVFTSATGTVSATLTSLGENAPSKIGFSMGTLSSIGTCTVVLVNDSSVVNTSLSGTVSTLGGSLCVRVYDVGLLADEDQRLPVRRYLQLDRSLRDELLVELLAVGGAEPVDGRVRCREDEEEGAVRGDVDRRRLGRTARDRVEREGVDLSVRRRVEHDHGGAVLGRRVDSRTVRRYDEVGDRV